MVNVGDGFVNFCMPRLFSFQRFQTCVFFLWESIGWKALCFCWFKQPAFPVVDFEPGPWWWTNSGWWVLVWTQLGSRSDAMEAGVFACSWQGHQLQDMGSLRRIISWAKRNYSLWHVQLHGMATNQQAGNNKGYMVSTSNVTSISNGPCAIPGSTHQPNNSWFWNVFDSLNFVDISSGVALRIFLSAIVDHSWL